MSPLSGIRLHFNAHWESVSPAEQEDNAGEISLSFRRLWKSKLLSIPKYAGGNPHMEDVNGVDEYIYLLVSGPTRSQTESIAKIVQGKIEENIFNAHPPDDIDFTCPEQACSYIIRMPDTK